MYAEHFGLAAEPFDLVPNPAYLYLGKQYQEAMAALQYGLTDRRGFTTLIGEVGTGKTTLLYNLLADLPDGIDVAFVSYADQAFPGLLSLLLTDLSVPHDGSSETGMLSALQQELVTRARAGRTVAFVIDEAQNLSDQTLERLRLLSNIETAEHKLLQIVLVGQPELQDRLRQQHLRQLNERVSVRAQLRPLGRDEMTRYVEHRLARVGGSLNTLFTPAARRMLFWRAGGIPRRANILFHNGLLFAFGHGQRTVTARTAWEAIREMNDRPIRGRGFSLPRWAAAAALIGMGCLVLLGQGFGPGGRESGAGIVPSVTDREAHAASPQSAPPPAVVESTQAAAQLPSTPGGEHPAAEPAQRRAIPSRDDTMAVRILPGATLTSLAREIYGTDVSPSEFAQLIDQILRLNPQVRDGNLIVAGGTLRLPAALSSDAVGKP